MSRTQNIPTTTTPDVLTGQFLGEARNAARDAYNFTNALPFFEGPRTAGLDPLQQQGAAGAQQMAGLFGPASQMMQGQAGNAANANNYFNAQQAMGQNGLAQQAATLGLAAPSQAFLGAGMDAGYGGLNTMAQANGLFGQGMAGQQAMAGQLNPYLAATQQMAGQLNPYLDGSQQMAGQVNPYLAATQRMAGQLDPFMATSQQMANQVNPFLAASQGLLNTNAVSSLDGRAAAGDAAQSQIGALGQNAAQTGFGAVSGALTGQPDVSAFMNPFQQNVLDSVQTQFDSVRNRTNRDISDRATAAGAFGGSREAVTRGAALADIARNETAQLAGLTAQGYTDAMNRAMQQQQFRASTGQGLFGQGLGALGQQAGSGDAATAQRLALFGQGLNNLGSAGTQGLTNLGNVGMQGVSGMGAAGMQGLNNLGGASMQGVNSMGAAGMQGSNALFNSGLGAGQFLAGYGQNNANALFGAGNQAGQFLATQGSYGANQQGQFANNAMGSLFGAGMQGIDALGQYGTLFQNLAQQGIDRNAAAMQEPITRRQQALEMLFRGVNGGGSTTTQQVTSNPLGSALGYATAGMGLYNQWQNRNGGGAQVPQIPNVNIPTVNIPYTGNTPGLNNFGTMGWGR